MSGVNLPWAPPCHDTGDESLFWIVCDVQSNPIDRTPKVTVRTTDDVKFLRIFVYCTQDLHKGSVHQLLLESSKEEVGPIFSVAWNAVSISVTKHQDQNMLTPWDG